MFEGRWYTRAEQMKTPIVLLALLNTSAEEDYDITVVTITSFCIATHKHICTLFLKYSSFRYGYSISMPAGTKLF
jgi:hypothetical protein